MTTQKKKPQTGFVFSEFNAPEKEGFDKFFEIFKEIITYTSGDVDEALDWLAHLDKEYKLSTEDYNLDDFIADLKKRGYLKEDDPDGKGGLSITAKTERAIQKMPWSRSSENYANQEVVITAPSILEQEMSRAVSFEIIPSEIVSLKSL